MVRLRGATPGGSTRDRDRVRVGDQFEAPVDPVPAAVVVGHDLVPAKMRLHRGEPQPTDVALGNITVIGEESRDLLPVRGNAFRPLIGVFTGLFVHIFLHRTRFCLESRGDLLPATPVHCRPHGGVEPGFPAMIAEPIGQRPNLLWRRLAPGDGGAGGGREDPVRIELVEVCEKRPDVVGRYLSRIFESMPPSSELVGTLRSPCSRWYSRARVRTSGVGRSSVVPARVAGRQTFLPGVPSLVAIASQASPRADAQSQASCQVANPAAARIGCQ